MLVNWRSGVSLEVTEPFLLCALHERHQPLEHWRWLGRVAALGLMLLTLPAAACVMCLSKMRGQPAWRKKVAVCSQPDAEIKLDETLAYYELASENRWLRRWPQLWNVARGQFTWIGNRPLSPEDASALNSDFERLWLAAPIGMISLADAVGCAQAFNDEAHAHASFYAALANWKTDVSIFAQVLSASLLGVKPRSKTIGLPAPFRAGVLKGEELSENSGL